MLLSLIFPFGVLYWLGLVGFKYFLESTNTDCHRSFRAWSEIQINAYLPGLLVVISKKKRSLNFTAINMLLILLKENFIQVYKIISLSFKKKCLFWVQKSLKQNSFSLYYKKNFIEGKSFSAKCKQNCF